MAQPDSNGLVCSLCDFPYKNRVSIAAVLARMSFAEFFGISCEQNMTAEQLVLLFFSMNNKVLKLYAL